MGVLVSDGRKWVGLEETFWRVILGLEVRLEMTCGSTNWYSP